MASGGHARPLRERNQQLTDEPLAVTRRKLAELSVSLGQLSDYVERHSRPQTFSTALGYISPFPLSVTLPSAKSPSRRAAADGLYGAGPLLNLFVDHDPQQSQSTAEEELPTQADARRGDERPPRPCPTDFSVHDSDYYDFYPSLPEDGATATDYPLGKPSDACLEILNHEGIVRQIMIQEFVENPADCQSLDSLVAKMLQSLLSTEKWERMSDFCNATSGWDKLGPITRWRLEPTVQNYLQLAPCYRPSHLQLTRHHWPIVDWIPYPGIRDELILHPEKYDLNKVCPELNTSFCFEMTFADAYPDFDATDKGISRTDMVYVLLQEFVLYSTNPDDRPSGLPVNENVLTHLLLAFRQGEHPFTLHHRFFDQFPTLRRDLYLAHGECVSIFGGYRQVTNFQTELT